MAYSYWPGILGMAITAFVVILLGRRNNSMPDVQQGMLTFRLPKAFTILGGVSIVIAVIFLTGIFMLEMDEWGLALFFIVVAAMFGYMGMILFRDGKNYRVACDERSIIIMQGHQDLEVCKWSDILSARVHPLSKAILLKTKDGRTLKLNAYLIGSDALFEIMSRRTELPVADLVAKARSSV